MKLLRIREILQEKNITGKELAERVEVSPNSISKIITGQKFPRPDLLLKIAEVLEVDIRELFNQTKGAAPLNGFVEYGGEIYKIREPEDLEKLTQKTKENRIL